MTDGVIERCLTGILICGFNAGHDPNRGFGRLTTCKTQSKHDQGKQDIGRVWHGMIVARFDADRSANCRSTLITVQYPVPLHTLHDGFVMP